jgi:hypothetical protein
MYGLSAVLRLGDHLPAWLGAQDRVETGPDDVVVVGYQDARYGQSCLPAMNPYSPRARPLDPGKP